MDLDNTSRSHARAEDIHHGGDVAVGSDTVQVLEEAKDCKNGAIGILLGRVEQFDLVLPIESLVIKLGDTKAADDLGHLLGQLHIHDVVVGEVPVGLWL